MADNKVEVIEVSEKKSSVLADNLATLAEPENFQKYVLGFKKNGSPRAIYDVVKDVSGLGKKDKKKKKKKHKNKGKNAPTSYSLYVSAKKKKKKKKNKKHWHI